MNLSLIKKIILAVGLLFVLQGCGFYVRGEDEYYEHHPYHHQYYHHGYWR